MTLLASIVSITAIILTGLAASAMARRRSAALRHWILAAAVLCALTSPFLTMVVPPLNGVFGVSPAAPPPSASAVLPQAAGPMSVEFTTGISPPAKAPGGSPLDPILMITIGWAAGVAVSLLLLAIGLARLRWLRSRADVIRDGSLRHVLDDVARSQKLTRPVQLLRTSHPHFLVTWGVLRPRILVPAQASTWDADRLRIVLTHEVAHIVRGDWIFQLAAELLRAACWFNPVVWMASKRLRHESERACDDVVLSGGVEGGIYARHLLEIARAAAADGRRRHLSVPAPAMVRPGSLERRVRAMLSDTRNRRPAAMRARIATAAGLFGISVAIAGFAASAQTLATVAGTVRDPHGRAVPGVTLTLIDARRDARQQARTDDQGKFAFAELTPGDYVVEGAMPGFKGARRNVTVTRGDVNLEIALAVGSLSESIHIMAEPGTRPAAGPRSSAARATRAAIECTPSDKGGEIRPPMKIKNVNPVYPGTPGDNLAGVVVLEGTISTDGRLINTKVLRSPHDELARAAIEAWEQWEFTPTLLNCVPIEVAVTGTFDFSLRK